MPKDAEKDAADTIVLDFNKLTWGELEELEHLTNPEAVEAVFAGKIRPSVMPVLIWIVKRREDASFTLDDARRTPLSVDLKVDWGNPRSAASDS